MQHEYLFDIEGMASLRVRAQNRVEAKRKLRAALDCVSANFGELDGDTLTAEFSAHRMTCVERDGEIVNEKNPPATYEQLADACRASLQAWEGEEDSVQEEHAELIDSLSNVCERIKR